MSDTKIPVEGVDCDQLHNYGNGYNNCNSVAIIWCIDDVRKVINDYDMNYELTDDDCMDVLNYVDRKHDATIGVTWETIYYTIENLFEQEIRRSNG